MVELAGLIEEEAVLDVCSAYKRLGDVIKYREFSFLSNEEISYFANFTVLNSHKKFFRNFEENINSFKNYSQNLTSDILISQIIFNKTYQLIKNMSFCFNKPMKNFMLSFVAKSYYDVEFASIDWHSDRGKEKDVRVLVYFTGYTSKFANNVPEIYKQISLAKNYSQFADIIGNQYRNISFGNGVIFKKGWTQAAHATPNEGEHQRFLASIDISI